MTSNAVIPLESNPEVFTAFAHKLGLKASFAFHDVYSITDKDLLSFIPRPCEALICLFPITEEYEKVRLQEESTRKDVHNVTWFKQTVKNACGLFALLNSISNLSQDSYEPDSRIIQFKAVENDVPKIEALINEMNKEYTDAATQGETDAPDANDDTTLHFISFIKKNGHIYELDGRRSGPYDLGESTSDGDIIDEDKLIERFQYYISLADDENKLNFSLMALAPSFD
ncbi:CYFA0S08e01596g1_1 [Cyberlindnera fabianii]|uniref:Ubiquitin carboxyl-terminal hydrolase n=1 Tax=Cyberlindnera fabianii TaxID=36022 RepID=A0A061B2N6_CYBFA|nr:CYFA0S08e01596g1_1 [Cyberlindnera fabianii]